MNCMGFFVFANPRTQRLLMLSLMLQVGLCPFCAQIVPNALRQSN